MRSALPEQVTVEPLDRPDPTAAGLMRPEGVGLPRALWAGAEGRDVIAALLAEAHKGAGGKARAPASASTPTASPTT